jgi:hypothetical protein
MSGTCYGVTIRCYVTSCQFSSQHRNVTHPRYGTMFCYKCGRALRSSFVLLMCVRNTRRLEGRRNEEGAEETWQ